MTTPIDALRVALNETTDFARWKALALVVRSGGPALESYRIALGAVTASEAGYAAAVARVRALLDADPSAPTREATPSRDRMERGGRTRQPEPPARIESQGDE